MHIKVFPFLIKHCKTAATNILMSNGTAARSRAQN